VKVVLLLFLTRWLVSAQMQPLQLRLQVQHLFALLIHRPPAAFLHLLQQLTGCLGCLTLPQLLLVPVMTLFVVAVAHPRLHPERSAHYQHAAAFPAAAASPPQPQM
jgi:hypothetical protein